MIEKILGRQKIIAQQLTKFRRSEHHQTAYSMSWWRARLKEQEKLKQLLNSLVIGSISASECLHQLCFVSLNLQCECYLAMYIISLLGSLISIVSNLFVRFNCDCWDRPSCTHGPSVVTVVIGYCELAHPVDSLVVQQTNSKGLKVH